MLDIILISVGCGLFAVGILRARLLSRVAAALLGSGLLLTAGLALGQHLAGENANVMVWPYALIGIASFGIGLTWLGWQLRVERPVDTRKGMAPFA